MSLQFQKQCKQQVRYKSKNELTLTHVRSTQTNAALFMILKETIVLDLICALWIYPYILQSLFNNLNLCGVEISHANLSE